MRALTDTPEPARGPAGLSGASDARHRDTSAIARVDAIVAEYGYLLGRVGALRQRIAEVNASNEPINRFAPPDQQVPAVLTGDEILAILNGEQ